jgi:hypothetical protein
LLGFTAFVRSSFQKKAKETDDREKEFELALRQFKTAQAEVDREYRRFHSERPMNGDASPTSGFGGQQEPNADSHRQPLEHVPE